MRFLTCLLSMIAATNLAAQGVDYTDYRHHTVHFPLGDRSFADEVVSYTMGQPGTQPANAPRPRATAPAGPPLPTPPAPPPRPPPPPPLLGHRGRPVHRADGGRDLARW